jgi:homocysteine S-methyltransferase
MRRSPSSAAATRTLAEALAAGPVVLDGGLATELERVGHDLHDRLWSARLLVQAPGEVRAAHRRYLDAGAEVVTTASYQASFEGFAAAGLDAEAVRSLLRRSVRLAREAVDGQPGRWVAASVGPYGAMLAGGEEYTGSYAAVRDDGTPPDGEISQVGGLGVAELAAWHRPRLEVLAEAGADVLACETVPSAAEAAALLREIARLDVPAWLSLTTVTGPDGTVRTRRGEPAEPVFALARDMPQIVALGVNCIDPAEAPRAVRLAARAGGKPVVVYPNSGETWDGAARRWRGTPGAAADAVTAWLAQGARLVGGCCRTGPADVRAIAAAVGRARSALVPDP